MRECVQTQGSAFNGQTVTFTALLFGESKTYELEFKGQEEKKQEVQMVIETNQDL